MRSLTSLCGLVALLALLACEAPSATDEPGLRRVNQPGQPNNPPTVNFQEISTALNTPVAFRLTGADPDGDALIFTVLRQPSNGRITGTSPNLTYTPNNGFNGIDSIDFIASDGLLNSSASTINFLVGNLPPTGFNQRLVVDVNTPRAFTLEGSDPNGSALTFAVVTPPRNGRLTGTAPNLTYTPNNNYTGPDTFTFTVNDGALTSPAAIVSIGVGGVFNQAPLALFQSVSTEPGTPAAFTLQGIDPDGDTLTFTVVRQPSNGRITGTPPNLTYTPNNGFIGQDSIDFTASDGLLSSEVSSVIFIVGDLPPQAFDLDLSTRANTPLTVTLGGLDPNGSALTFQVLTQPENGDLSGVAPNLTYTPDNGFNGLDTFTYTVNDGRSTSPPAKVNITIGETGFAPTANPQALTIDVGASTPITLTGSDPEEQALTFEVLTQPTGGQLTGTAPNLTYTPNQGFEGLDEFTFRVFDGVLRSPSATVTITVGTLNLTPVAFPQALTTAPGTPLAFRLGGTDPEGAPLTFAVVAAPQRGQLSGTAPNLTYTPNQGFEGEDRLIFTVNDGQLTSARATITFAVGIFNTPPVALPQSISTEVNTPVAITLGASDEDGDALTFEVFSNPTGGTLSGVAPNLTYTPNNGFVGADIFTFRVSDGEDFSPFVSVLVRVGVDNLLPEALSQALITNRNTPVAITLSGSDPEGSPLTFAVVGAPQSGQLAGTAPNLTYTPNQGFEGNDVFTFRVNDGLDNSAPASVLITVGRLNQAPFANDQELATPQDTPLALTLDGADPDGGPITIQIIDRPTRGALSGTAPNLVYTPNNGFNGIDSFTWQASDGQALSGIATVEITVGVPNELPVALSRDVVTNQGTPVSIVLTGQDPEGALLTFIVTRSPDNGRLAGAAPNLVYTPNGGFTGVDTFDFVVDDGEDESPTATIFIFIGVNPPPQAQLQQLRLNEDASIAITLRATDPDGGPLSFQIVDQPDSGQLTGQPPNLVYRPNQDFFGIDSFDFKANDGVNDSNTASVILIVAGINDPPKADDLTLTTNEEAPATFSLPAIDPDGDLLLFEVLDAPLNGQLIGVPPNLTYVPNPNFAGTDDLTWRASDGQEDSEVATVTFNVVNGNDPPTATAQDVRTAEDTPLAITLRGTDLDGDNLGFIVLTQPTRGALSGTAPNLTYTPNRNTSGADSFTFRANDGRALSATATIRITVDAVNDPPEAFDGLARTPANAPVAVTLRGQDEEGSALTFAIARAPASGRITGTAPNVTYTPNNGFEGDDTFTFTVNDGALTSPPATIFVRVDPPNNPNSAPVAQNLTFNGQEDTPLPFTLIAQDADDDLLLFELLTLPNRGTVEGAPPALVYTPPAEFAGQVTLTWRANDGLATSNTATVTLNIAPANDPPSVFDQLINTNERLPVTFALLGEDPEGDALTFEILTQPRKGTLSGQIPNLTYTPNSDSTGEDTLTFRASDGRVNSATGTIRFFIAPINDPPTADNLAVRTDEDTPVSFTLTADDPETPQALVFVLASNPTLGRLSGAVPNLTYTPNLNASGTDRFTFLVNDGQFNSNIATVNITITGINDPPIARDLEATTEVNTPVSLTLVFSDEDDQNLTVRITDAPDHGALTGTAPNLTYTPEEGFGGEDTFVFSVSDGRATATGNVRIFVNNQDLPPPVVTLQTPIRWFDDQARLVATVTDSTCNSTPTASASPDNIQVGVAEEAEGRWRVQSQLLPEGLHAINLTVTSRCSGRRGNASAVFGIDATPPTLNAPSISQDGVVVGDPATWPAFSPDARINLSALLRDPLSGLARVNAALVNLDDQRSTPTLDLDLDARLGQPPAGPRSQTLSLCANPALCDDGSLDLARIGAQDGDLFALRIQVRDVAGNLLTQELLLRVGLLRPAIVAWRQALAALSSDIPAADALIDGALIKLDLALQGVDRDQLGNTLLALEDAYGLSADARFLDSDLADTDPLALEIVALGHALFEATLGDLRRDLGPRPEFNPAGVALDLARAQMELELPGDALLALANAFFWIERGQRQPRAASFADALGLLDRLIGDTGDYIGLNPPLTGRTGLIAVRADLIAARADLGAISARGPVALDDAAHLQLAMTLADAARDLKALEEQAIWVRGHILTLALIEIIVQGHNFERFGNLIGVDHPVVLLGIGQIDAAVTLAEGELVEDLFETAIFSSQCLLIALESIFDPRGPAPPLTCCDDLLVAEDLDRDVVVPRACTP